MIRLPPITYGKLLIMMKSRPGILIAAIGWLINLPYWAHEILVEGNPVIVSSKDLMLEHILIAGTIPVFMVVGYFFQRGTGPRKKLLEYSEFLEDKVKEGTGELRQANDKLKLAYEELKELSHLKDSLISNVSHELRTPITIAKGAIDLAYDEKDPRRREKLLSMAMEALERQNRIVGDLIIYHENKKVDGQEVTDLAQAVAISVGIFRKMAEKRGVELRVGDMGKLPLVRGNMERVIHVLSNLLDNAIKFNHRGGEVVIETGKRNGKVEVCVTDTGIGIPGEKLKIVFDRFYQVDPSLTRRYGGTGMGLAVARKIVEGYGGEIRVESEVGRGSRFCFTLPVAGEA
jgi:signal transduction histidine kinase